MKVDISETGTLSRTLAFTVPSAQVSKMFNKFCDDLRSQVTIPGFRKGNATNDAILTHYREDARKEVANQLLQDTLSDFYKQNLNYTGMPTVGEKDRPTAKKQHSGEFKLDGSYVCSVDVEIVPTVEIKDYVGLEISEPLPDLDRWLQDKLQDFQYTFASREPTGDRKTEKDDELIIDFEGSVDGEVRPELKIEMQTLVVGQSGLPKVVDDQLVVRPIKEEFEFDVVFPADYGDPATAGKTVHFKIFIHSMSKLVLHPINEDLAKMAVYESLDAMKADLKLRAQKEVFMPVKARLFSEIISQIINTHSFEVPRAWIDIEFQVTCARLGLKEVPKDEQLVKTLTDTAERVVRQNFILNQIYRKEDKIHLSPEEVNQVLGDEAKKYSMTADKFAGILKQEHKYDGFLGFFENNRTIDFLIKSAKIKGKE